jgi:DNA-binding PadR family transcriptional regulator
MQLNDSGHREEPEENVVSKVTRGRKTRIFHHGGLKWIVLSLLEKQPTHGYGLIRTVESLCAGAYTPSPGVMYPALNMLEDQGFILNQVDDSGRKNYSITPLGKEELLNHQAELDSTLKRLQSLGSVQPDQDHQVEIRNALKNIKRLLKQNLTHEETVDAHLEQIKNILGKAEQDIESLFAHNSH